MNSLKLKEYHALAVKLFLARLANEPEDDILNQMDVVWYALNDKEVEESEKILLEERIKFEKLTQ